MDPSIQMNQPPIPAEPVQENQNLVCDFCHTTNPAAFFFCPNCGKVLRQKPLSTSIPKQAWVYFVALFFPPFGIFSGIKYLRQKTTAEKTIGIAAIILTLISLLISAWLLFFSINKIQSAMNEAIQGNSQSNLEQQLQQQLKNVQPGNDLGF